MRRPTSKAMYICKDMLRMRKAHQFCVDPSGFGDQICAEESGKSRCNIFVLRGRCRVHRCSDMLSSVFGLWVTTSH